MEAPQRPRALPSPALPAQHRRPGPTPAAGPETSLRSRASPPRRIGKSSQLPGSECGRRLACGSRWAPPPDCRAPPPPAAALVLSRPQPSPLYSPPPPNWVRPAALRPNKAWPHWSGRPSAVQHYSLLLVNLKQGAGPEKGGSWEVERRVDSGLRLKAASP